MSECDTKWDPKRKIEYTTDPNAVIKDVGSEWRNGEPPNYTEVREKCENERTTCHKKGSLEQIVENVVKNWEIESTKKVNLKQWRTIDLPNYQISSNGAPFLNAEEAFKVGNYNLLINESTLYSSRAHGWEESHDVFKKAMPGGFAWEVLELYSGPPTISFKWRHWGTFEGPYKCIAPNGKTISSNGTGKAVEMIGFCVAKVTEDIKVTSLEIFYDADKFLQNFNPQDDGGETKVEEKIEEGYSPKIQSKI